MTRTRNATLLDRVRAFITNEPARFAEFIRAILLIGTVVFGLQIGDAESTAIVTSVVTVASVFIQNKVRDLVTPMAKLDAAAEIALDLEAYENGA